MDVKAAEAVVAEAFSEFCASDHSLEVRGDGGQWTAFRAVTVDPATLPAMLRELLRFAVTTIGAEARPVLRSPPQVFRVTGQEWQKTGDLPGKPLPFAPGLIEAYAEGADSDLGSLPVLYYYFILIAVRGTRRAA